MNCVGQTRSSLLMRVKDVRDQQAWKEFVEVYAPIIYRFALARGLQDADASDLTQHVLAGLTTGLQQFDYDRERGAFRSWLFKVTQNELRKSLRHHPCQPAGTGDTNHQIMLEQWPSLEDAEDDWNREHQRRLFEWAAPRVRKRCQESTWKAFWEVVVNQRSASEVARQLGISVGSVYVAKKRILMKLKAEIDEIENCC